MGFDHSSYVFKSKTDAEVTTDVFTDVSLLLGGGSDAVAEPRFIAQTSGPIGVNWKNTDGANGITTQILGSNDKDLPDADWEVVVAAAPIAALASRHVSINPASHHFYKFQHKATVGGSQGKSQIRATHKRV
jgi:hypothetical protein